MVSALDPHTGFILWQYDLALERDCYSDPALGRDGTIYFGGSNRKLYAIRNGALIWESADAGTWYFSGSPSIAADGMVYCGADDGYLYAFGPGSGGDLIPAHVDSVSPESGDAAASITIIAGVKGSAPLAYTWNFGGGATPNTSTLPSPTVTLGAVGTYNASLTLSNAYGVHNYAFLLRVYNSGGNTPPSADLQADPTSGNAPLDVEFDASGSTDLEGPIASYDWALKGDHVYDDTLGHSSTITHTYMLGGSYQVWVRVTDLDGATDEASIVIDVSSDQSWHFLTLDSNGQTGVDPDLEIINGTPAISYKNNDAPQTLFFIRSADANGDSWGTPVTVTSGGQPGCSSSLATINGNPAIAYYDGQSHNLCFVRSSNANGSSWTAAVDILYAYDSNFDDRFEATLLDVASQPAISFLSDNPYPRLNYIRALDANGVSWPASVVNVDPSGNQVGAYNSMLIVNGVPAIAYCDSDFGDMMYVRALDATGAAWGTPISIEGDGFGGIGTGSDGMLALIGGVPAVTYSAAAGASYCQALDASGTSWGTPVYYDVAQVSRIAAINGTLVSLLCNAGHSKLYVRRATDLAGTTWQPEEYLTTSDSVWSNIDLASVNGHPATVWFDNNKYELKYAIYY